MKHFVLTLLGLLSFCLAIRAEVYSGECGDNGNNLTWTLDTETGKLVISGNGAMTQNPWRDYRNYIRTVDIQEGVTSIVNSAFADCSNLTNATIAASVTRINYYAFLDCISLSNITIPNNATYIGSSAFEGCTNLLNIIIPCTTIESYAFQHCTNLKKITIKNGVKEIKKGAFDNCTSIEKVIVEDGEETLTLGAGGGYNNGLFHNSPIKNLYIGRNLEYNTTSDYGYSPFYALRTILSLNIGSQVSLLKDNAFNNCTNLNSITCQNSNPPICGTNTFTSVNTSTCKLSVPKSSVNTYKSTNPWSDFKNIVAFSPFSGEVEIDGINYELNGETKQATVLAKSSGKYSSEVVIPESVEHEGVAYSVTSIGENAFYGCSGLTSVTIPNSVTGIGKTAFYGCTGLTSVTIPNSVTSIEMNAFYGCTGLTSVTIPNSVTSIEGYAFYGCSGLTSVAIPNSVTSIGQSAFSYCSGLTSVTIPNSVTSIGGYAFRNCTGLTSVTIPNSVTSIGESAFNSCDGLTSVTIPNSVTSIGDYAFRYCSGLQNVYCHAENVPSTGSDAFSSTSYRNVTLHVPAGSIESYKTTAPWSGFKNIVAFSPFSGEVEIDGINYELNGETKQATVKAKSSGYYSGEIVIPESVEYGGNTYSVTSIGDYAFYGCSGLTSVTIPNSVKSIGNEAFCGSPLKSVKIPESVTHIGLAAFYGSHLQSIEIPGSVTDLSIAAFGSCRSLQNVILNEGLKTISWLPSSEQGNDGTFEGCENLVNINIPSTVTTIGVCAFQNCSSLESVRIPNSVTSIEMNAFYGCSGLTSVTIPNSVTNIGYYAFRNCTGLTEMRVDANNSKYDSREGCNAIIETSSNTLLYGCQTTIIPNSVTSIGEGAFYGCSGLTSVTIPNSVTSIEGDAFAYCSGLQDVYCYAENVPSTGSDAFYSSNYSNATLHVPAGSIESYRTTEPWSGFGTITALKEDLTLADGEEFENVKEKVYSTLTYTRTLPNLYWNALYVPFEIPVSEIIDKYEVAYVNNVNSYDHNEDGTIDDMRMEVIKIKSGTLNANYPYLIKARNEEAKNMTITLENTTLFQSVETTIDCSSVFAKHEITGIYNKRYKNELPEGAMAISMAGAWQPIASGSYLNPFRLYMTITARDGSPVKIEPAAMSRIRISVLGEDVETDIEETRSETKNIILDLSGRSVQNPVKGGVYIVNGKKVIF